jgi:hypothetical protein
MPVPERQIDLDAEAKSTHGRSLFVIPWQKNTLIRRESLTPIGDIRREILPLGGLKVSSNQNVSWRNLLKIFESSIQETELSGEMIMYAVQSQNVTSQIRIPFGMFDLCRDEIDAAFPASEPNA